jgi:hypothetical protein
MDGANPYAPPEAALADRASEPEPELPVWRLEGPTLFVRHGATLPDICLYTGEPTTRGQRLRYPLSWMPLWYLILVVVLNPGLAVLSFTHFRRLSSVVLALGPAGRRRHRLFLGVVVAASTSGVGMLLAVDLGQPAIAILFLLCLIGLVVAGLIVRTFSVGKIGRKYAHLRLRPAVAAAFARLPPPPASL